MTTFEPICTEPGRWDRAPAADAPAAEILAYLRHCDICEFHAMLNLEEDLSLDYLLRDACRDLVIDEVERPASAPAHRWTGRRARLGRQDRMPQPRFVQERFHFERSLMQACIAAFSIVVLWIAFATSPFGQAGVAEEPVAQVENAEAEMAVLLTGEALAGTRPGHLYVSRALADNDSGQPVPAGGVLYEEGQLTAAAPRPLGSILRVTNPQNGHAVEVKIVKRIYETREIFLPSLAADSLGLDGDAIVFVEVIFTPPPVDLAP